MGSTIIHNLTFNTFMVYEKIPINGNSFPQAQTLD